MYISQVKIMIHTYRSLRKITGSAHLLGIHCLQGSSKAGFKRHCERLRRQMWASRCYHALPDSLHCRCNPCQLIMSQQDSATLIAFSIFIPEEAATAKPSAASLPTS